MERLSAVATLVAALALAAPCARAGASQSQAGLGEFFIISSLNQRNHQVVLKRPTEVTQSMTVNAKTVILGEDGKAMKVGDLRSGDTVYVSYTNGAQGLVATRIQLGPMTVQVLHERYLRGFGVPIPAPPAHGKAPPKTAPHSQPARLERGS